MPLPTAQNEPQYGDIKQSEDIKNAAPLPSAAAQPATPQPAVSPQLGAVAGQNEPIEEEFQSPFSAVDIPYEQAVALWSKQIAANLAIDERSHPDMKELFWASGQDLQDLRNGGNTGNAGETKQIPEKPVKETPKNTEQSSQTNQQNNKKEEIKQGDNSEMIALLKEIRDKLGK